MIRIVFKEPETNVWRRWVKDCEKATAELRKIWNAGKAVEITDLYKRKSIKEEVYFSKAGPFRGRCAYCEANIRDFQHGDIEHFRPKQAVTDENDIPVRIINRDGTEGPHPGYYWLAYDWRNLLPSCTRCNQPADEGIGKRCRFPLESPPTYASKQEEMIEEKPLLLNPVDPNDDDPEDHLDIDLETGTMTYKNNSKRGEMCIKIFGLNIRDQLVEERRTAINEVKAKYVSLLMLDDANAQIVKRELEEMERGSLSHTLARRAQIRKIEQRLSLK